MELTVNLVLIIVGLIICLGGIYFKKAVAGLVGMVSGMELGAILTLFLVFSADSDERGVIVIIFVCAAIGAILCATYDRICGAIGAFFNSALVTLFMLLFTPFSDEISVMIFIVLLVASIVAYISYLYDRISFILTTAVTGAFLASVGVTGICYQSNPADMLMAFIFGATEFLPMLLVCTLVLSVIGIQIQWKYGSGIVIDLDSKKAGHNTLRSDSIYDIKNTAKEATHTAENVTKNLISQIRTIWENYNSEEHKYFLLICGFAFLWPFCWKTIINHTTINLVYTLIRILSLIFAGSILALVVYCVYHKDKIFNAACVAALVLGNLFWQRDSISYFGISGWISVLLYLIIVVALYIIKEKLNGAEKLIWKLLFSALVIQEIIIPIIDKILIGYAGFSLWNIIRWGAAIIMLAFLTGDYDVTGAIKKHKKIVFAVICIVLAVIVGNKILNIVKEKSEIARLRGNLKEEQLKDDYLESDDVDSENTSEKVEARDEALKNILCNEEWEVYDIKDISSGERCMLDYYGMGVRYMPLPTLYFKEDGTFQFDFGTYGMETIGEDVDKVSGIYQIDGDEITLYYGPENQMIIIEHSLGYDAGYSYFDDVDALSFCRDDIHEFYLLHPSFYE